MKNIDMKSNPIVLELQTLTNEELHKLFLIYYNLNHKYENLTTFDKFIGFLYAFEINPFRPSESLAYREQMIENLVLYTDDYESLLTAARLIKKDLSVHEVEDNYYAAINAFANDLF